MDSTENQQLQETTDQPVDVILLPSSYSETAIQQSQNVSILNLEGSYETVDGTSFIQYDSVCPNLQVCPSQTARVDGSADNLKDLLKSWSLEHLTELFLTQKIDIQILKIIKQHHITALFKNQSIGDLVLFEHNLSQWKKNVSASGVYEESIADRPDSDYLLSKSTMNLYSSPSSPSTSIRLSSPEPNECSTKLAQILNSCKKSSAIIKYYDANLKLLDEHRQYLITIICNYFAENDLHLSLSTSYRIENEILNRFPTEKLEYYRVGKRGKLYSKFNNAKSSIRLNLKRSLTPEISRIESIKKNSGTNPLTPEANAEEYVSTLKNGNLSMTEFDSCWQASSHYRLQEMKEASSLDVIFKKWPEYKLPTGYRLIKMDFVVLFGNRPGIVSRWTNQAIRLYQFLLQEKHLRDKEMRAMLEKIEEADVNSDSAAVKLMWCLHGYLFPTQKCIKNKTDGQKGVRKFTIKSSQEWTTILIS